MSEARYATGLTGGTATDLDFIDGDELSNDDFAFTLVGSLLYVHKLDATSGAAESSPDVIAPDTNPGNKRWLLQRVFGADLSAQVSNKTGDFVLTSSELGKSVRMNSSDDKTFTFPSVGADEDGNRMTLSRIGTGKLTLQMVDSDIIGDSNATGTLFIPANTGLASITVEYVHAIVTWVIVSFAGAGYTTT